MNSDVSIEALFRLGNMTLKSSPIGNKSPYQFPLQHLEATHRFWLTLGAFSFRGGKGIGHSGHISVRPFRLSKLHSRFKDNYLSYKVRLHLYSAKPGSLGHKGLARNLKASYIHRTPREYRNSFHISFIPVQQLSSPEWSLFTEYTISVRHTRSRKALC